MRASIQAGSIVWSSVTSANTGIAPAWTTENEEAINEYEGTITKTFSIIEGDKEGCTIHWIIAVVLVICAAIMYALAKTSALRFVIAGVGTVIAVAIAFIVGHCGLDLPIAIIGSIILIVEAITLNKTKKA